MAASLSHLKYLSAILYWKGANVRTGLYTESYKLVFLQETLTLVKKINIFPGDTKRAYRGNSGTTPLILNPLVPELFF